MQHVALVTLVLATGLMLVWPEIQGLLAQEKTITTLEATQLLNQKQALIIDLRRQEDFDLGHLPNARNIPPDELKNQAENLTKLSSRPVILVASSQNTGRARHTLIGMGFTEVFTLKGGVTSWIEANLPLARQANR